MNMMNIINKDRCKVCRDERRAEIDKAILVNTEQVVADTFGFHRSVIHRHKAKHLIKNFVKGLEVKAKKEKKALKAAIIEADVFVEKEKAASTSLLDRIEELQRATLEVITNAKNNFEKLRAIEVARKNLELVGKLTGELRESSVNITNVQAVQVTYPWEVEE